MNKNTPILKGSLTKLSAALFALLQSPSFLGDVSQTVETFNEATQTSTSYLSLVAVAGMIWGAFRSARNYFQK